MSQGRGPCCRQCGVGIPGCAGYELQPHRYELVVPILGNIGDQCCPENFSGVFTLVNHVISQESPIECGRWTSEREFVTNPPACDSGSGGDCWRLRVASATEWELRTVSLGAFYVAPVVTDAESRILPPGTFSLDADNGICTGWPATLEVEPI